MRANQLEKMSSPTSARRRSFTRSQSAWCVLVIDRLLLDLMKGDELATRRCAKRADATSTQSGRWLGRAATAATGTGTGGPRLAVNAAVPEGIQRVGRAGPRSAAMTSESTRGGGGGCCVPPAHWPTGLAVLILPLLPSRPHGTMVMHIFQVL